MLEIAILTTSLAVFFFSSSTTAAPDTFVYGGCARVRYAPNSAYESNLDSLLTSLVNSAAYAPFNKFSIGSSSSTQNDVVYGLYQCQGNLPTSQCFACVGRALSQLGVLCTGSCGGVIQLEGCFVKYDNATFLGVEDKTVMARKCAAGYDSEGMSGRDEVLSYVEASGNQLFRVGKAGSVEGVAQCTGDLSAGQCQDCLGEAIGRLKSECGGGSWGGVFLGNCYVRYTTVGDHASPSNGPSQDDEIEKVLIIIVGLIAGVALIIIILAFLRKLCDEKDGK